MSASDEGFVTVAEAASILGMDARQVRRYAERLSPTDRAGDTQRTHKGQPTVRCGGGESRAHHRCRRAQIRQRTRQGTRQRTARCVSDGALWEKLAEDLAQMVARLEPEA